MKNTGLSEVIRYEEEIKLKIQKIDNMILQAERNKYSRVQLNEVIEQQEILLKYLQVESSKMSTQVRNLYSKNINRFKKKIKQHKQYFQAYFGVTTKKQDIYNIKKALEIEKQNNQLFDQKITMYENQRLQGQIGHEIRYQGQLIQQGINQNQEIRRQADDASDAIKLIHNSIMRRKIMFYSIFILTGIAIIFIILHKLFK